MSKKTTVGSDEYIVPGSYAERIRLLKQDMLINEYAEELPDGYVPRRGDRIGDFAAGTCGWIRGIYRKYPYIELHAIDNSIPIIEEAKTHELTKNKKNVHFHTMDVLQPLDFPDNFFDVVNMRCSVGFMPKEMWIPVLKEYYRICKPGGILRLTEASVTEIAAAPAYHRMQRALMNLAWKFGKSFAETETAQMPMLFRFVREAGFVKDIRSQCVMIDISSGADAHDLVTENFEMVYLGLKDPLLKIGAMSEEEFDRTFKEVQAEFRDPAFAGLWYVASVQGRKPA